MCVSIVFSCIRLIFTERLEIFRSFTGVTTTMKANVFTWFKKKTNGKIKKIKTVSRKFQVKTLNVTVARLVPKRRPYWMCT